VLRVRAAGAVIGASVTRERLAALATAAGASLAGVDPPEARFTVADDAAAARLLRALIEGGVPVTEAAPEESRLERLFLDPPPGGPA
jgi:hypothetical protein